MDPWTDPDSQTETTLQAMITRLEERGRHPMFRRLIGNYSLRLEATPDLTILEIGCGTGAVLREIASRLPPEVHLYGADISESLLAAAKTKDLQGRINWIHSPTDGDSLAAGKFDVVIMHTLLSHVAHPKRLLEEAARLLKPGGQLVVFDADHASTTYAQPSYEETRKADFLLSSAIATHPDICRRMPSLLKATGFKIKLHYADTHSECGAGDYWLSSVRGFARMLPSLGIFSPKEGEAWVDHMLKSHEDGTFFAAGTFYTFLATRE